MAPSRGELAQIRVRRAKRRESERGTRGVRPAPLVQVVCAEGTGEEEVGVGADVVCDAYNSEWVWGPHSEEAGPRGADSPPRVWKEPLSLGCGSGRPRDRPDRTPSGPAQRAGACRLPRL